MEASSDPLKDIKVALIRQQMATQFPDGNPAGSGSGSGGGGGSRRGYSRRGSSGGGGGGGDNTTTSSSSRGTFASGIASGNAKNLWKGFSSVRSKIR